ncbi:MAG: UvrD-helicase domain-containing protein [Planctomycetota bacterium]
MPGLNPAQNDAVTTLSGPLLVLAGAGTGKTRVVTHRIAELIRHGTPPERILAVTFTRKAAGEMQERAGALLKKGRKRAGKDAPRPEISTFHSLCVRVLRRHIGRLGYPDRFTIADRSDQESAARAALREVRAPTAALKPGDLLALISNWKMKSIRPPEAASHAETDREHLAAIAYRRYQNRMKGAATVDFDDLLLLTEELFTKFPTVRRDEASRFDHVMIDEYQDTNRSQYEIVKGLAMGHRNLCVVGDDDQSIYAWRGAEVTHILSFKRDWPEAKVVRLEDNYRSRQPIISMANTLIVHNAHRHDKVLRPAKAGGEPPRILQFPDETEEAKQLVADIRKRLEVRGQRLGSKSEPGPSGPGVWRKGEGFGEADPSLQPLASNLSPGDFAILFRTNEQPRAFEAELRAAKLPYVLIGGMSFYDRREVRDVLAYLRLIANPDDEPSLLRVLNTPPRGIGDGARKRLMERAVERAKPLWHVLGEAHRLDGVSPAAAKGCDRLVAQVKHWQATQDDQPLGELVERVVRESRYRDELARLYPDTNERDARMAAVEELVNAAAEFEKRGSARRKKLAPSASRLAPFLDELAVGGREDSQDKESQLGRNAIALMTLHSAKGLEFPHVYLVGMEEGILPHKRSLDAGDASVDEERRLAYVGVTRAQERLTLSLALTRRKWGKARDTIPSRFLFEMTGQAERANTTGAKKPKASAKRSSRRR